MKIDQEEIDQEEICDYCEKEYDVDRYSCEGKFCKKAKKSFRIKRLFNDPNLDFEETFYTEKVFNNLSLEDNIYCLKEDFVPGMESYQVISLYRTYKGSLQVTVICKESAFSFRVPKDFTNSSQYKQYYLVKEDCEQKLKEICLQGIITLSKIMGGLDGSSC